MHRVITGSEEADVEISGHVLLYRALDNNEQKYRCCQGRLCRLARTLLVDNQTNDRLDHVCV